jgi:hypothetical protein
VWTREFAFAGAKAGIVRMQLYQIDPLVDTRWNALTERHPDASVFHSTAWLKALQQTYGFSPVAYSSCPPENDLENAVLFCRVKSWLTGRRLVSLPFSDHCDPLVSNKNCSHKLCECLAQTARENGWRYVEIRPLHGTDSDWSPFRNSKTYWFHQIDLNPDLDSLFHRFHKNCTQRKIQRAEREGFMLKEGRSSFLIDTFYKLQLLTRRRHGLPPQPYQWFRNLADCFGEALNVSVAFLNREPAAATLTLRFRESLVYKYGCSNQQFHRHGAVHLLLWNSIRNAKHDGLQLFDLGRSDAADSGLVTFKDRWGAKRSSLTYRRYPADSKPKFESSKSRLTKPLFRYAPDTFLSHVGNLFYKHIG